MFYDNDNDNILYTYSIVPATSVISFDSASEQLSINAGVNDAGVYTFSFNVTDIYSDTGSTSNSFTVTIYDNQAPVTTETFTNNTMLAYYDFEINFDKTLFTDANNDPINFAMTTNSTWIQHDTADLKFYGTPNNSHTGLFVINLTAYDDYNGVTEYLYSINVTENHAPVYNSSTTIANPVEIQCMHPFQFNFSDYFYEEDNEVITIEDMNAGLLTWMSLDTTTHVLSGFHTNQCSDSSLSKTYRLHDPKFTYTEVTINFTMNKDHYPELNTTVASSLPNITWYEGVLWTWDISPYFFDMESDTISYNASCDVYFNVDINTTTGVWSGTPTTSDVFSGARNWYHYLQDQHYPDNSRANLTQYVHILNNTSPANTTTISDKSYDAGYLLSFSFSSTLFQDEDGESVTSYSFVSSPDATGWLNFDSTTRTFSGTPTVNTDALNYTITVIAEDPNPNSNHGNTSFNLEIIPNKIPEIDQGLYTVPVNQSIYHEFTYTVPTDAFKDFEGDAMTISPSVIPNEFTLSYDSTTRVVSGTLQDNSKGGNYTMHLDVVDIWNVGTLEAEINFTYYENLPPSVVTEPTDPAWVISHFPFSYSIPKSYFNEPENEQLVFQFSFNDTDTSKTDWINMSSNSTDLTFSGTPNNTQFGNFTLTIDVDDGNNQPASVTTDFVIWVNENQSPVLTGTPATPDQGLIGFSWSYIFAKSFFSEPENEALTITGSVSPADAWILFSENTTHFTFSGLPDNALYSKTYTLTVSASDPHSDVADTVWSQPFTVGINYPPTIGSMDSQSLLAPDGLTWSYGANLTSDPEGLAYTTSLEVNGSSVIPNWLVYDLTQFDFAVITSSNSLKGTYEITIVATDDFNPSVRQSFLLTILENTSPQVIQFLTTYSVVNFNLLDVQFPLVTELFSDPDNRTLVPRILQFNSDPLPEFLAYNTITNTLSGTPEEKHVGDWALLYIVEDDHNQTANISFTVTVKPWYFKCHRWTGEDYNQCTYCKSDYFLQYNQCKEECVGSFYEDYSTNECEECHPYWKQWEDGTNTNCSEWNPDYYFHENQWLVTCPDGYYNDENSGSCKPWDIAWTKWHGPTTKMCDEWNSSLLYLLVGTTQCSLAQWIKGFYLNHTDLECYKCEDGWDQWEYPNNTYCQAWNSIHIMTTPGVCTHWYNVTGYYTNEFGIWEELWGDGLNLGQYAWDDGNQVSGDGWSNTWAIESGYTCQGTRWWEKVKPFATITSIDESNVITLTFSEPVRFHNKTDMIENINLFINGPSSPYDFKFEVANQDELVENQIFTEMVIRIYDLKVTLLGEGSEKIFIWWTDLTVIEDRSNNTLSDGKIFGILNSYIYVSDEERSLASNGGSGIKYTVIAVFMTNIGLKFLIASSAALMWSLVHVLQSFRYILMMNIQMPEMIDILMEYLVVVIGEIDELEDLIPDLINDYVIDQKELTVNMTILSKFEENGYETPYLNDQLGKQILLFGFIVLIIMPFIFLMKIAWNSVRYCGSKFSSTWSDFFWNAPVRTFLELYIEISLGVFLHSLNIRFQTSSGIMATTLLFIAGLYVLFFPFALLRLIWMPSNYVKSKRFNNKFGTLTEDIFKKKTLMQKAYYPLFLFQRFIITLTLVYLYYHPFHQMIIIMTSQILMISYLIKCRPFKSELQQVITVSDEFIIIFGVIILYFLWRNQHNVSRSNRFGFAIVGIVVFSLLKNLGVIIYLSITGMYVRFRTWVHK